VGVRGVGVRGVGVRSATVTATATATATPAFQVFSSASASEELGVVNFTGVGVLLSMRGLSRDGAGRFDVVSLEIEPRIVQQFLRVDFAVCVSTG